jgi:hypothetical protein
VLIWLAERPGGRFLIAVLVVFFLILVMTSENQRRPRPYEPPDPCRVKSASAARTWGSDRGALHVRASQTTGHDRNRQCLAR